MPQTFKQIAEMIESERDYLVHLERIINRVKENIVRLKKVLSSSENKDV